MNLYFNNEEYFFIKNTKLNGINYTLYMDDNTKSKIIILDENKNIVIDKYLSNNIMSQVFRKYSEKYADDYSDDEYIDEEMYEETPLSQETFDKLCDKFKKYVIYQFGEDVISEEEIDRRIKENLESIVIDPTLEIPGQFSFQEKKIRIQSDVLELELYFILYHEYLHALASPGVQKVIAYSQTEEYEYGRGIDEGIIASLQRCRKTKKFTPYIENISYPHESELTDLIAIVYENTNKAKKDNLNFYDEYIKDSNKTLERIYTIFEQNEEYLQKYSNISEKDKTTLGMSKALDFVLEMDELYGIGPVDNKNMESKTKKEDIYNKLKKQLENLLMKQIINDFPTTERELYEVLYSLESFKLKSRENNGEIDKFKKEVIKEFLNRNKDISLDELEDQVPPFDRQNTLSEDTKKGLLLFTLLFKDYSKADPRCIKIVESIKELKQEQHTKKNTNK